jgi:RNA polymerase sigma factor (sigma-70 family)
MPRPARDETYSQASAFTDFVHEHQPMLARHVARVYVDQEVGAVVAGVLATAWRRLDDIPEDRPDQWLKVTARNIVLNMRRGDARWKSLQRAARDAARATTAAVDDDRRLEAKIVFAGLATLSAADQALIRMQAAEEPTSEELAAILGISVQAARTRLSRARQRLHDVCEQLLADGEVLP